MNLLIGVALLLSSIGLFSVVAYLFLKKETATTPEFLYAEVTTEDGAHLLRLLPLQSGELRMMTLSSLPVPDNLQSGFGALIMKILGEALPGEPGGKKPGACQVIFYRGLIESRRAENYPPLRSREILSIRTLDRKTKKGSDNIKLMENFIPPEMSAILWQSLVTTRAGELISAIAADMAKGIELSTVCDEWLGADDTARLRKDMEVLSDMASGMIISLRTDTEAVGSRIGDMDKEYTRMLSAVSKKASETGRNMKISATDKEKDTLSALSKYEEALNVYLKVLNVRLAGAVLGALTPLSHKLTRQGLEECRKFLEEERGQLTMMLKIVDSADSDQFFAISQGELDKEPAGVFSLIYPAYLLQELLKWYKKLRVTERVLEIKNRLQMEFWDIETRTNEMLKLISDSEMYTETSMKGDLSVLLMLDENGLLTDMKKIVDESGVDAVKVAGKRKAGIKNNK